MSTFDIEADLAALFDLRPGATPAAPMRETTQDVASFAPPVVPPSPAPAPAPISSPPAESPLQPNVPRLPTLPTNTRVAPPVAADVVTGAVPDPAADLATSPAVPEVPMTALSQPKTTKSKAPKSKAEPKTKTKTKAKTKTKTQAKLKTKAPKQQARKGSGGGGRVGKLALVVVLLGGGAGAAYAVKSGVFSDEASSSVAVDAPAAPAATEWDPRVTELVAFVEATRGLTFEYPVAIDSMPDDEIEAFATSDRAGLTSTLTGEQMAELFNARGLTVSVDDAAGSGQFSARNVVALYSFAEDRIVVRAGEFTPAVNATLVHELTHALQAQTFELVAPSITDLAMRAILEGDADRVQEAYLASLTTQEAFSEVTDEALTEEDNAVDESADDLEARSWAVLERNGAPWALGSRMVNHVFAAGGNAAVDELFRNPPSEERLVSPWLDAATTTDANPDVAAPEGSIVLESPRGLSLFDTVVMLDAWLPWTQTRGAIDGWAGGGYVSYARADGVVCFAASASFDADPAPFAAAVTAWAAAAGSAATPTIAGSTVSFEACSRGADAPVEPEQVFSPTTAMYLESDPVVAAGDSPTPETMATALCYVARIVDDPAIAEIAAGDGIREERRAALTFLLTANAEICGHTPPPEPG